ncbi:RcnB family protein [Gluconobacter sphaericus]|uniref:RcnB family protein n=1 Tax=Gluconobacter sphaericus TaxID=574987 RepID=UPI001920DF66|nr:RcnB family protein [Gluconobacter sphaericus]
MKTRLFAGLMATCFLAATPLASADPRGGGPGGPGSRHGDFRGVGHGGGQNRIWRRGDRYDGPRDDRWAVNNWRSYRGLYAPPRGYYWMRYGNQFLLTALATGLIAGVVTANSGVMQPGVPVAPPPPPPGTVAPGYGPGPY